MKEGVAPEKMTVRAVPLAVPEEVFLRDTDRKRAKKGLLGGTEEKIIFAKTIFLPYLDFTYRFPAEKGLVSKQTVISEGRSTILALREANFGFDPRLVALIPMLADRKTKLLRWKMFADGLQLPPKLDLDRLELLEGTLFYMPYFIAKLSRGGERRYIVWNREGKEDETIADEMTKNNKFRALVETHALG